MKLAPLAFVPVVAISCLLFNSIEAHAQAPQAKRSTPLAAPLPPSFDQLDANGDDALTANETRGTPAARTFAGMDTNNDGTVSRHEYLAAQGIIAGRGPNLFQALDANNDGAIDRDEASADSALARRFRQADADGNGLIDRAELSAFEAVEGNALRR